MFDRKKFSVTVLAIVAILSLTAIPVYSLGIPINPYGTAETTVTQFGDLAIIVVKSPINVAEYQIVYKTPDGEILDSLRSGFMEKSTSLYWNNQYRWFNLETSGDKGITTIIFEGCVTVERVNMLDSNARIISSIGLPVTLCEE